MSPSGDGKKSSMILTRLISPLPYLTVGFFIVADSIRRRSGKFNLAVMPAQAVDGRVKPGHDGTVAW
jgi:hypothetical protein